MNCKILLFILSLLFFSGLHAQNIRKIKEFKNVDNITYTFSDFTKKDTMIDSVEYSHIFYCKENKITVFGNYSSNGTKQGDWALYKKEYRLVSGKYNNDLKQGWWDYDGCCRTEFKNDKKVRIYCATF